MLPFAFLLPASALLASSLVHGNPLSLSLHGSCSEYQFQCASGRCIPKTWICDGEADCPSYDDESHCKEIKCLYNQFECQPGSCIPDTWVCDGQADCAGGKDEHNCTSRTCGPDLFSCKTHNQCIQRLWVCDGDNDCEDNSDELNCPTNHCRNNEFACDTSRCISSHWRCDGDIDCSDGSDERDCPNVRESKTWCVGQYLCKDQVTCIPNEWTCDGDADCPEEDDENLPECHDAPCRPDEFKCHDHRCISGHKYCDGFPDCADSSDERNCSAVISTKRGCQDDEFDCGGNMCIPISKACDGHQDCPNNEDEPVGKCNINECSANNGGCSHKCVDTPTSYHCTCNSGFKLVGNQSCEDINECDNPGACSHTCINEIGTFKCECLEGYMKDPYDRTRCKPKEGHTYLLFTRKHDIRKLSLDQHEMSLIVNETKSSAGLDFLFKTGMIFWSDLSEQKIYKATIGDPMSHKVVTSNGIVASDGLAVDWIYDHIYWTDTGKNTIEVANLDGSMKKTLISGGLDEPRAIVVNPLDGWMYWSDWGEEARIEKAGLDGSHRQVIVSYDIKWPNGLTLDLVRSRLYWLDAKLNSISSVNYDGTERTVVLKSTETLHHPFSISVFEDFVYWTDWHKNTIFKANKFNGENIEAVTGNRKVQGLMVVHAYHPYRQPNGTNYCSESNTQCTHLCLPAPQISINAPKISCACPDGLAFDKDGVACIKGDTTITNPPSLSHRLLDAAKASAQTSAFSSSTAIPIVIMCVAVFLIFSSLVAFIVYKNYLKKNLTSVNFDNPVYRKTTDDQFSLIKTHHQTAYIQDEI